MKSTQFYIVIFVCVFITLVSSKSKSGPYRATVVRTNKCASSSRPYEKPPSIILHAEVHNSSGRNLVRGKAYALKQNRNVLVKVKGYYDVNGKWQLSYFFNKIGCRGPIMKVFKAFFGFNYDSATCIFPPGNASFSFDYNDFEHKFKSEIEYGRMLWVGEAYIKDRVTVCQEFETSISPV